MRHIIFNLWNTNKSSYILSGKIPVIAFDCPDYITELTYYYINTGCYYKMKVNQHVNTTKIFKEQHFRAQL